MRTEGRPAHREEADPEKLKVSDGAAKWVDGVVTVLAQGRDTAILAADAPTRQRAQ